METTRCIFDRITDAAEAADPPALRRAVSRWSGAEPPLSGAETTADVLARCRRLGDSRAANAALAALLRVAGDDDTARQLVLVALAPGLKAAAWRLARTWGADPAEVDQSLAAAGWSRITALAGTTVTWPATAIVGAARDEVRALLRRQARDERREQRLTTRTATRGDDEAVVDALDVLRRAVHRRVISPHAAQLIVASRLLGFTPAELARLTGRIPASVRKQRQRAEAALAAAS